MPAFLLLSCGGDSAPYPLRHGRSMRRSRTMLTPDEHEKALSPEALAMLEAGLESAKREPAVDLGSFAQYAVDPDETPAT